MTTLSIQVKGAQMKAQALENLDAEIPTIGAQRIYAALLKAQALMKTAGKPIRYPVNWDSERQRRAYFASDGFGAGIPYRRTGAYEKGWYIRRNPRPSRAQDGYSLIHGSPIAKYIGGDAYGNRQSNIHRNRWVMVRDTMEKAVRGLPQDIAEHIGMVSRRLKLT
ncbi:MAG: hypothetical protein V1899_03070 [Planctomycetota bacterium]